MEERKPISMTVTVDADIYPRLYDELEKFTQKKRRGKISLLLNSANSGLLMQDMIRSGSLTDIASVIATRTSPEKKPKPSPDVTNPTPVTTESVTIPYIFADDDYVIDENYTLG